MKRALPFFVFFVSVFVFLGWQFFRTTAESAASAHSVTINEQPAGLSNYDIRTAKNDAAQKSLADFRRQAGIDSAFTEAQRKKLRDAETDLNRRSASLKIEYSERLQIPEIIAPDVVRANKNEWLTVPTDTNRAAVLRSFLKQNPALFGLDERQINALKTTADYMNPDGNLSFVHLEQEINGLPVFQGEVKAGFTKRGEIIRIVNNLAPSLAYENLSTTTELSAERAVSEAAKHIGIEIEVNASKRIVTSANENKVRFERGRFADETTVEKIYFPTEAGVARLAWRVLLWQASDAFYVIVDAGDGTLLWRKNITDYQTQAAIYNVYGNTTSMMKTADSPAPRTPGCLNPSACPQPSLSNRTSFSLIGNEAPYNFNNLGWIPDGENRTTGNNAEAGIDRDGINGVDPQGYAFGTPPRNFVYAYNPAPGNPSPGEEPLPPQPQTYPPSAFQQGSVTNAFYATNRFHDEMYLLGFTEAARNFQADNFGRGGIGGDHISVEVQDSSGTNNTNFASPSDGGRGRLQLYVFTGTIPNRDGALDNQAIVHELTHGVSNRLHGNSGGLGGNMAGGMGEGWSDFYALALLAEPSDSIAMPHPYGSYSAYGQPQMNPVDYYYGLRRFPYAVLSAIGPNGFPHNPLTFGHLNANSCGNLNGAFPPRFNSTNCGQAAFIGEVWASALWEVRFRFVQRLGFAIGNRKVLQIVTDGMKLAPLNPTMLQERDAILIAAQASAATAPEAELDAADVWRGFARRGMGFGAQIISAATPNVVESFALPQSLVKAKRADFDGDGKTDLSVYRPNEGNWYLNRSTAGFAATKWGLPTDITAPGDFDGDRKTDLAVFRPTDDSSQPDFYILRSSDSTFSFVYWGLPRDIPVIADYDGDGKDDVSVFRESSPPTFYVLKSTGGFMAQAVESLPGNLVPIPITGDFDGDGKADFNYTTVGTGGKAWVIRKSGNGYAAETSIWGVSSDLRAPADYDGDGIDDVAIYRRSEGMWYIRKSTGGISYVRFGNDIDVPVSGDYDGDGKADTAVYRHGTWYLNQSTAGFGAAQFGISSDIPIPNRYITIQN